MKKILGHRKARTALALLAIVGGSAAGLVATSSSAFAGTLGGALTLTLSNNADNFSAGPPTTSNTSTYTYSFSTATADIPTTMSFTVPADTTASSPSVTIYGFSCTGTTTVALASSTFTVTLPSTSTPADCPTLGANTPVEVAISGVVNGKGTTTISSTVTVNYSGGGSDTATITSSQSLEQNTTSVDVVVPDSLTFTNSTPSITLFPTSSSVQSAAATLNVQTNAVGGYTLDACAGALTYNTATIPFTGANTAVTNGTSAFGAEVSVNPATNVTYGANSSGGTWSSSVDNGYDGTCDGVTHYLFKDSQPTSGDAVTITNHVAISATQPAGDYKTTINYLVTPTY